MEVSGEFLLKKFFKFSKQFLSIYRYRISCRYNDGYKK